MVRASFKYFFIIFSALLLLSFKPEDKFVRKAMRQLEKGNLKGAKTFYTKALEKNPENYKANLGMGLLLSELLANYSGAQSYLEKAYKITEKDTVPALMYALAKCYQHNGEYEKALGFFEQLKGYKDVEEEIDLEKDIEKRKADCRYGILNRDYTPPPGFYIVNAGKSINTDMPEYVPVLTPQNELIFTSRRQDDEKEQLSYLDGKYFESMYIAKISPSGFHELRRYTLPDQFMNSKFLKNHESVVSMSPDGKKLFTFHNSKIYEINVDERASQKPKKLLKTVNFDYYQNHAFLTKDGSTLYFTSEAKGGMGGIDIYKSTKIKEGEWSKPENLGAPVNTELDEDAPFITDDGKTMYFASTGHEGYGNFDIYKSELVDGKWSKPQNLGQPINSPGHDIFMIIDSQASVGYFSSSRSGGHGDMDIYKINYLDKMNKDCPEQNPGGFDLIITDEGPDDFKNKVEVKVSEGLKVLEYEWKINDSLTGNKTAILENDYMRPGTYVVSSKVIAYCDTCVSPLVVCNTIQNTLEEVKTETVIAAAETSEPVDLSKTKGQLEAAQLKSIGFDSRPILFDFAKSDLNEEAENILKTNIEVLKKNPSLKIEIMGYTDSRGPQAVNKMLSAKRAKAVKDHLLKSGVKKSQIKFISAKGASDFVNDCGKDKECDEASHQQNRRVEFKIYNQ